MVDEARLEGGEDRRVFVDREVVLRLLGLVRGKCLLEHLAGQACERERGARCRHDEQIAPVERRPPLVVAELTGYMDVHFSPEIERTPSS